MYFCLLKVKFAPDRLLLAIFHLWFALSLVWLHFKKKQKKLRTLTKFFSGAFSSSINNLGNWSVCLA